MEERVFGVIVNDNAGAVVDMVMATEGFAIESHDDIAGFVAEDLSRGQRLLSRSINAPSRVEVERINSKGMYKITIATEGEPRVIHEKVVIDDGKLQIGEHFIPIEDYLIAKFFIVKPRR